MTRFIKSHQINPANTVLTVEADEPTHGGASHEYTVTIPHSGEPAYDSPEVVRINFQKGPVNADGNGVNGLTHEVLLAIIIDRLQAFQSGPYACRKNALALIKLEAAVMLLNQRTANREARGVEGTHTV